MSPADSHIVRIRGETARKDNELIEYQASYNKSNASFSGFNKFAESSKYFMGTKSPMSHSTNIRSFRNR